MRPPPVQVCPSQGPRCWDCSSSPQCWLLAMGSLAASGRLFGPRQQLLRSLQAACGQCWESRMQCNTNATCCRTCRSKYQELHAYRTLTCMATAHDKDIHVRSHSPDSSSQLSPAGLLQANILGRTLPKLTGASSEHCKMSRKSHLKRRCSRKLLLFNPAMQSECVNSGRSPPVQIAVALSKHRLVGLSLDLTMCARTHEVNFRPLTLSFGLRYSVVLYTGREM